MKKESPVGKAFILRPKFLPLPKRSTAKTTITRFSRSLPWGGVAIQIPSFLAMYFVVTTHRWQFLSGLPLATSNFTRDIDLALGFHFLPVAMTIFTLANVFLSSTEKSARIQGIIIAFLFLFLLYDMPSILVLYWTINMLFSLFKTIIFKNKILKESQNFFIQYSYSQIACLAILNISFLICFFAPVALYQSDIHQFEAKETLATLTSLFGFFILFSFLGFYLFQFIPRKFYKITAFILSFVLFFGLANNFIWVGNYGPMDKFILQNSPELFPKNSLQNLLITLFCGFLFVFIFFKKKWNLSRLYQIIFCTLLIVSFVHSFEIYQKRIIFEENTQENKEDLKVQTTPWENELFSYSKNEKNIVVIVLDMFTGSHMADILEQFPQFKTILDGFTHFPNAVSSANATIYTMPSIIAGPHYTIYKMNERKDEHTTAEAMAYYSIGKSFANENFDVGFLMYPIEERKKLIDDKEIIWVDELQKFQDYFFEKHPELSQKYTAREGFWMIVHKILSFGLFRFSPDFFARSYIYNNGKWLQKEKISTDIKTVLERTSSIYTLTHSGNTKSKKSTFKFLYTSMTHFPYFFGINEKNECEFFSTKTIWKRNIGTIPSRRQYETEVCAFFYLQNYLEWLKKENIYDNTQIFFISDHAGLANGVNIPQLDPFDIELGQDILFLFKDFNQRGELKTDWRLMANYDISGIFCENLKSGCPNVPSNILKNYPENREIVRASALDISNNLWGIYLAYKIRAPIDDPKSYTDVSAEYATIGEFAKKNENPRSTQYFFENFLPLTVEN